MGEKLDKLKLLYIKRCDSFNNASFGTHMGFGAKFDNIPRLPHSLHKIIISHNAVIGKNCTIYHQVTIGEWPTIGDNVWIGPGAKIFACIHIGNNVRIGANLVVSRDVPDDATVRTASSEMYMRK